MLALLKHRTSPEHGDDRVSVALAAAQRLSAKRLVLLEEQRRRSSG